MDDLIKYNKERWEALAKANIVFSRPALNLDESSARRKLDPYNVMGDVKGKEVLCLAGGGGQQSVAFAILGARVTVFDLSDTQLERDREAAAHYGFATDTITMIQGDMRDLSRLAENSFDLVWHAHSIGFIPDVREVFAEVSRVIRQGGLYRLECPNPFVLGIDDRDWNGEGYVLKYPYVDGVEVKNADPRWEVWDDNGNCLLMDGPREFRHTLSSLVNGLVERGFTILGLWEELSSNPNAPPGTWDHFTTISPPGFSIWSRS